MLNATINKTHTTGIYTNQLEALLVYLKTDQDIAETFAYHVQSIWSKGNNNYVTDTEPSKYLIPTTREEATKIAAWLPNTLPSVTTKDARTAVALAMTWAKEYQEPKAIVLGIVGVAVIGPTFGLIKKKKEKNSVMRVMVAEKHFASLNKKELTRFITKNTGAQLATELKTAAGNTMNLHPDTFDWTFSDHEVEMYTHNQAGLKDSIATLESDLLPHTIIKDNKKIVGVVVSPIVNDDFIAHSGAKAV